MEDEEFMVAHGPMSISPLENKTAPDLSIRSRRVMKSDGCSTTGQAGRDVKSSDENKTAPDLSIRSRRVCMSSSSTAGPNPRQR